MGKAIALEEQFWSKVDRCGPNDCWNWTASTDSKGYGQLRRDRKYVGRTTCKNGHEWTPENSGTATNSAGLPHRVCITCRRATNRRYKSRVRAARLA